MRAKKLIVAAVVAAPMTMAFQVVDPAVLERIRPGDKVKLHADTVGGAFIASNIEIAN